MRRVLAVALLSSTAWAAPQPMRLVFLRGAGAESCPDEAQLRRAVTERLGTDPVALDAASTAIVELSGSKSGVRAVITFQGPDTALKRRELSSPTRDCSELFRSVELAVAIAIDPHAALAVPPPAEPLVVPPPPSAEPTPAPVVVAPAPPPPQPPAPSTPWSFFLGPGIYGAAGLGPTPTAGASLLVGVRRGWLGIELQGRADLPSSLAASGGTLTVNALAASLALCLRGSFWGACALGSGGALRVSSQGLDHVTQSTVALAGIGTRLFVQFALVRWLAVRASFELEGQVARTTVLVNSKPVWGTSPVAGLLGAQILFVPW
jgi:hypothetical protein